jgi:methylenetetrahydrofolate dehydrogenase (NADP+)/methenyltetrahydrofolate cyclohydrolase
MKLISGSNVAEKILHHIQEELSVPLKRSPCLVFILVGNHAPSESYVKMKAKACERTKILSRIIRLEEDVSFIVLKELIEELNEDDTVDGILVQMPLPEHLEKAVSCIAPSKDVDGFSFENMGKLSCGNLSGFIPCTPQGIYHLLQFYHIELEGKHTVIVGRSNIVGKPLANLLLQKHPGCNATVTVAHAKTKNLKQLTQTADILIVACGKACLIDGSFLKKGACVIDVGINRVDGKIVGDCDFDSCEKVASKITPVPGGVGPMTIACLLLNTYISYKQKYNQIGSSKLGFEGNLLIRME